MPAIIERLPARCVSHGVWAEQKGVELEFIKLGRPRQNGLIERVNRSYREAVLNYVYS